VAFATFCIFDVLNLVRVNLFLYDLTGRADWQSMMARFRASEFDSVRAFVTMDYIKDAPLNWAKHMSNDRIRQLKRSRRDRGSWRL
jgi:hypothetical protein